ncbi:MAG: Sir2 family NAD-dependent protein deacetylase [Planctomycetes bacterium]|nr:Sir2 family NAD-dependent protein deacetylase [Planctomycetota bacterium]
MKDERIRVAARWLHEAERVVVFTGAGISTESGIPDFRSPGGVWSRYNQDDLTYQRFRSHERYRKLYWEYDRARFPAMRDAQPNAAHHAVVEIERSGRLAALVTQNIDGLHQKAGSSPDKVLELHGTVHAVTCLDCDRRWNREEITARMEAEGIDVPYCEHCGGPLKCATIAFGQSLPADVLDQAFHHARHCDLFLTVGSSLVVQPAALLPAEARRAGAKLVLINLSDTPYDAIMDILLIGKAGPTAAALLAEFARL